MRRMLLPLLPALVLFTPAPAEEPTPPKGLAANAALKYWQAFAHMPALDQEQEKLIDDFAKVPLDGPAGELIDASTNALIYLHRAAQIPECDWSLHYEDGPGLLLPHLQRTRTLSRLALLKVRRDLEQGRTKPAVETALDVLTLARHTSSDATLISILIRYMIEANTLDLLAGYLPKFETAELTMLAAELDAPPGGRTPRQSIEAEKTHMVGWLVREMKKADQRQPGAWRDLLRGLLESEKTEAMIKEIKDLDQAVKMTEELYPAYDELARLIDLPPAEFDAKYPPYSAKISAANSLAGLLLPQVDKVVIAQRRNQVQRALFRAAIDIVQDQEKAKTSKDPFGDGPFEFKAIDGGGFELTSKLVYRDKPVSLTVGKAR